MSREAETQSGPKFGHSRHKSTAQLKLTPAAVVTWGFPRPIRACSIPLNEVPRRKKSNRKQKSPLPAEGREVGVTAFIFSWSQKKVQALFRGPLWGLFED